MIPLLVLILGFLVFRLAAVLPIREPLQIVFILATLVAGGFIW
jgi:hypothetical protein